MGQCFSNKTHPAGSVSTTLQRDIDKKIEEALRAEQDAERKVIKCLLLGAGECGKSTILKQMKILHLDGFKSPEEKSAYKALIWKNTLESVHTLCNACDALKIPLDSEENGLRAEKLLKLSVNDSPLPYKSDIMALWRDSGIQKAVARASEFHLLDSAPYFLDALDRILSAAYEPTTQDILRSRIATTGIIETEFVIDRLLFRMYDVGGQRGERKKWIHCFENVTAIMFIASLSEYDQVLAEDRTRNRLKESLDLFEGIINLPWFKDAPIILFLNKDDLFRRKIQAVDIGIYFPQYTGGTEYGAGLKFIQEEYFARNLNENKTIYCFGDDARVLTDRGFLFEPQIRAVMQEEGPHALQFACYDVSSQSMVYATGTLVHPPNEDGELISFTSKAEARRWGEQRAEEEQQEAEEESNGLSLRVTGRHIMYASQGTRMRGSSKMEWDATPSKMTAASLLSPSCSCADAECEHRRQHVRFLTRAAKGYAAPKAREAIPFVSALALRNETQIAAFLELYGFWLGCGSLVYAGADSAQDGVAFTAVQPSDVEWVKRTLRACGLERDVDWHAQSSEADSSSRVILVTNASWFNFFNEEYWIQYPAGRARRAAAAQSARLAELRHQGVAAPDADSSSWLCDWALKRLDAGRARLLVSGLHRAAGSLSSGERCIFTSDPSFRDRLLQLLLHAGYTAFFDQSCSKDGAQAAGSWRVQYTEPGASPSAMQSVSPSLARQGEVSSEVYKGALWCVRVHHSDHLLFAQRAAAADERGVVTRASRPVIVGNCHVTDATNTENIAFVWKATKHIILEQNITRSGLRMC